MAPEAKAAVERFERERAEGRAAARVPSAFGVRRIGSLALVEVGHSVWTDPEKRRNHHDEPMGGIVLAIDFTEQRAEETGEITVTRRFHCYDPLAGWNDAFKVFADTLIPVDGAEMTPQSRLAAAVRRFCKEVGRGHSLLSGQELELVTHAFHLAAALGGIRG